MKQLRRQSGFTLLELITVIAVVAIIAAMAVPNFRAMMTRYRLNGASRQLMADITAARMQAISRQCPVSINVSDDHIYRIWTDENRNGVVDTGEEFSKDIRSDYTDVTLYRFVTLDTIVFNSRGAADQFFLIGLKNPGGWKSIYTNITGRVKII